jgi:hypothetical protein
MGSTMVHEHSGERLDTLERSLGAFVVAWKRRPKLDRFDESAEQSCEEPIVRKNENVVRAGDAGGHRRKRRKP